jgi:hypothetical protein
MSAIADCSILRRVLELSKENRKHKLKDNRFAKQAHLKPLMWHGRERFRRLQQAYCTVVDQLDLLEVRSSHLPFPTEESKETLQA